MSRHIDGRIFVGNLPSSVVKEDLEDLFYKFGKIRSVDLKNSNHGTPFAFIEFDDPEDARDAVRDRDGYRFKNLSLRVEHPHGSSSYGRDRDRDRYRDRSRSRDSHRKSSRYDSEHRSRNDRGYRSRYPITRRSNYRVIVTGLPRSGSWQDVKDHMRTAGDVVFADVNRDCVGIVEFASYDDMKYAVDKLDSTRFKSHEGEESEIRVKECDDKHHSHSSSRSRSRSISKKRSRSRSSRSVSRRSRSRSYSRSKTPIKNRSSNGKAREETKSRSKSRTRSASPRKRSRRSHSRSDSGSPRTSPSRKSVETSPVRED